MILFEAFAKISQAACCRSLLQDTAMRTTYSPADAGWPGCKRSTQLQFLGPMHSNGKVAQPTNR